MLLGDALVARLSAGIACLACLCVAFEGRLSQRRALRRTFALSAPASAHPLDLGYLRVLAWLDPVLMVVAVSALAWALGARAAWLACIFWSTQASSSFTWTGGAFLRQD